MEIVPPPETNVRLTNGKIAPKQLEFKQSKGQAISIGGKIL